MHYRPHMLQSTRKLTKSLCLIVWNELEGSKLDVPRLPLLLFDEVYAIDGGSTDGTVGYLEAQGIRVYRQRKKSLNAAYREAVDRSQCEAVAVFFPKGTIDPGAVREFVHYLDAGIDLVVASRNVAGALNEEDRALFRPRKWGVGLLSRTAAILWRREGWRIRDVLHGVKAFTVEAFDRMHISDIGVTVDLEMTVRAYRLRVPRCEFPVLENPRPYGESKFTIWRTGKKLGLFLLKELFVSQASLRCETCRMR
jgi:hypothetical protein